MTTDYEFLVHTLYFLYLYVQKYKSVASVGPPVAVGSCALHILHTLLLCLQLSDDLIKPSDHVRLLTAADLSLDRRVSNVCKTCFFWLRQLGRVRRSLDIESVKTLVHAFVIHCLIICGIQLLTPNNLGET